MRHAEFTALDATFLSRVMPIPKKAGHRDKSLRPRVLVGFDTEFDSGTKHLLSMQFAATVGETIMSTVVDATTERVTVEELVAHLVAFLKPLGLFPLGAGEVFEPILIA